MVGRVALRDDRTLILFVFTRDAETPPAALGLAAQKAMLRKPIRRRRLAMRANSQ